MSSNRITNLVPRFLRIHKARIGKHWVWGEHTNQNIEMVLIKKGKMRCVIDNSEFVAKDGDMYFIQPGQLHYEELVSEHVDIFTLRFELLDKKGNSCSFIDVDTPKQQLLRDFEKKFGTLFERILQLVWDNKPGTETKIETVIMRLIRDTKKLTAGRSSKDLEKRTWRPQLVQQAVQFISQNINENLTVTGIAEHCCVSPSHLTHVFTDSIGTSPIKYVHQLRMDQAKRLLADETLCVYEVADKLGFNDPFYFSRLFKKVTGFSPQAFRNHIRKAHL